MFSEIEQSIIKFIQDRKEKITSISPKNLILETNEDFFQTDTNRLPLFFNQHNVYIQHHFYALDCTQSNHRVIFSKKNIKEFKEELDHFKDSSLTFKSVFHININELFKLLANKHNIKINIFRNLSEASNKIDDSSFIKKDIIYSKVYVFLLDGLTSGEVIQNDILSFHSIEDFNLDFFHTLKHTQKNINFSEKYMSVKTIFDKPDLLFSQLPSLWVFNINHPVLDIKYLNSFIALVANSFYKDTYTIKGQHNLKYQIKELTEPIDFNFKVYLEEIISSLLDNERHFEKLLIARTAITTYIKNETSTEEFIFMCPEILDTFEHHFDQYVQNEVKVFLDQKNNVLREVLKVTDKVNQEISNIQKDSRKYIFSSTITILVSLFFKSNISNGTLDNNYVWNLLSIAITFSMGYFILHLAEQFLNESKKSVGRLTDNFENYFSKVSSNKTKNFTHDNIYGQFLAPSVDAFNNNYNKLINLITHLKIIIIALFCVFCSLSLFN